MMNIGDNIRTARKRKGFTQEELAKQIGVTSQAVSRWESGAGMQVIRFCSQREWVERTHFALTWIYIHENDFVSAREHIDQLPSVKSNRLQESILAQVACFEQGLEGMKVVLNENLQNMVRVMNKEILYAVENMVWSDSPENALPVLSGSFGRRSINRIVLISF